MIKEEKRQRVRWVRDRKHLKGTILKMWSGSTEKVHVHTGCLLPRAAAAAAGESSPRGAPMTSMHFRASFSGSSLTHVINDANDDGDVSLLSFE